MEQVEALPRFNELLAGGELPCKRHIELAEAAMLRAVETLADQILRRKVR